MPPPLLKSRKSKSFTECLVDKRYRSHKERIEKICTEILENPTHAKNSHRLQFTLSKFRTADLPKNGRRGDVRIVFGLNGEHPDVPLGEVWFFAILTHDEINKDGIPVFEDDTENTENSDNNTPFLG